MLQLGILNVANINIDAIRENKILAKCFELFTVHRVLSTLYARSTKTSDIACLPFRCTVNNKREFTPNLVAAELPLILV